MLLGVGALDRVVVVVVAERGDLLACSIASIVNGWSLPTARSRENVIAWSVSSERRNSLVFESAEATSALGNGTSATSRA